MSDEEYCLEARLFMVREDDEIISEEQVDELLDAFQDFAEERGICCGGAWGRPTPEEKLCGHCEGSGERDFIDEEDRCETCGGSGRKDEEEPKSDPEAVEEWNDLYAPIAQGTEQPSPKGQVEGSNPSGSANVRDERVREDAGESGGQDSPGDS